MSDEPNNLDAVLRKMTAEGKDRLGPHPPPERLDAYHSRQLSAQESESMQEHLVFCRDCTAVILDLASRSRQDNLERAGVETGWSRLMAAVQTTSRKPSSLKVPISQRFVDWLFPAGLAYALGTLLLAISIFSIWMYRENKTLVARLEERDSAAPTAQQALLEQELEKARRERDDERARVQELEIKAAQLQALKEEGRSVAQGSRSDQGLLLRTLGVVKGVSVFSGAARGSDEFYEVKVAKTEPLFTFLVVVTEARANRAEYNFEIEDLNGNKILTRDKLRIAEIGGLPVTVRTNLLPAGKYRFKVYEVKNGVSVLAGERLVELQYN